MEIHGAPGVGEGEGLMMGGAHSYPLPHADIADRLQCAQDDWQGRVCYGVWFQER